MTPYQKVVTGLLAAIVLGVAGCVPAGQDRARAEAPDAVDTRAAAVAAPAPRRIVSLVPAATEILFALGAQDRLVGRTRWGVHPPAARAIADVGDGMRPALEAVVAREPDLVLLYDGEANVGTRERLNALGIETLSLRHDTLVDLELNIVLLGDVVGCPDGARELADWIRAGIEAVAHVTGQRPRARVYYEVWADPPITIGRGSFIDSLLTIGGAENVFGDLEGSAPRVSLEAIVHRDPDQILIAVAPDALDRDPGLAARRGWSGLRAVSQSRISLLDQDLVTRLGPRLVDAALGIARAVHPDLALPARVEWEPPCDG